MPADVCLKNKFVMVRLSWIGCEKLPFEEWFHPGTNSCTQFTWHRNEVSYPNENLAPVQEPEWTRTGTTRSCMRFGGQAQNSTLGLCCPAPANKQVTILSFARCQGCQRSCNLVYSGNNWSLLQNLVMIVWHGPFVLSFSKLLPVLFFAIILL